MEKEKENKEERAKFWVSLSFQGTNLLFGYINLDFADKKILQCPVDRIHTL